MHKCMFFRRHFTFFFEVSCDKTKEKLKEKLTWWMKFSTHVYVQLRLLHKHYLTKRDFKDGAALKASYFVLPLKIKCKTNDTFNSLLKTNKKHWPYKRLIFIMRRNPLQVICVASLIFKNILPIIYLRLISCNSLHI